MNVPLFKVIKPILQSVPSNQANFIVFTLSASTSIINQYFRVFTVINQHFRMFSVINQHFRMFSVINQYFRMFSVINQYFSVFSVINQYFSVFQVTNAVSPLCFNALLGLTWEGRGGLNLSAEWLLKRYKLWQL